MHCAVSKGAVLIITHYTCSCSPGYFDDTTDNIGPCKDVDECDTALGLNKCDPITAFCDNIEGDYRPVEYDGALIFGFHCNVSYSKIKMSVQ